MGLDSNFPVKPSEMNGAYDQAIVVDNATSIEALFRAIDEGDTESALDLARYSNADLSILNNHGQNPLHRAIVRDQDEVANALAKKNYDDGGNAIHDMDREGYTPLMLAVEHGNMPLAKRLIEMKAGAAIGHDVNCSAERLSQKHNTIIHTILLLETDGDSAEAHKRAVANDFLSFEKLIFGKNTLLRNVCERGDVDAAKALISKSGADASFILMRTLAEDHPTVSPDRAKAIRTLIAAGADLSAALMHAIEADQFPAVQSLLCLGAPGDAAMATAIERRDEHMVTLLQKSGVDTFDALMHEAMLGNTGAVKFLLSTRGGALPQHRDEYVLTELAKRGNKDAVKLLIKEGVNSTHSLIDLLSSGNADAIKLLISAGADASEVLETVADIHGHGATDEVYQLKILIDAGVDPSRLLFDRVRGKSKDIHQAKMLIAAGAKASAALAYAADSERNAVSQTLVSVSKEVLALQQAVKRADNSETADVSTVGRILAVQLSMAQPESRAYRESLKNIGNELAANGDQAAAKLLFAIEQVNWADLRSSSTNRSNAAMAVTTVMKVNDSYSARLLMSAGASPIAAITHGIRNHNVRLLANLIDAGVSSHRVLQGVLRSENVDLAKKLIQEKNINLYEMFHDLINLDEKSNLKVFIPILTDGTRELLVSFDLGDRKTANVLVAAGVDTSKALNLAIRGLHMKAVQALIALGADKSAALLETIDKNLPTMTQMLLCLGADPVIALQKAVIADNKKAVEQLTAMGVSLENVAI